MRRVKKKKNKTPLKTKIWVLVWVAVIGGGICFYRSEYPQKIGAEIKKSYVNLMHKTQLVLKEAQIKGHVRTKKEDIQAVAELSLGMPIFDVNLNEIHEKISALPWVKSVIITRQLPSALVVKIEEKTPIAMWQNNKKYLPLDEAGEPIEDEKTKLPDLILVVGGDAPKHTVALLNILNQYPVIRDRVKSAVRVGNRRWNLILDQVDGIKVELPERGMEEALKRLQDSIEKDEIFKKDITSINLREGDRLIVTRGGKK